MKKVRREELLDYVTYGEQRDALRMRMIEVKARRRVHLGPNLTFLFESSDTVRYQIQEMMRAESIVKESDIRHELDTYNELLGNRGELGATLLIELDDPAEREVKLVAWRNLPAHLFVVLEDGSKVRAGFDPRQVGDDRLSSVQYLRFETGGRVPVALRSEQPGYVHETRLTADQAAALREDLSSDT
ncbi:MAG: DUF3501 family protein [Deltaproteobacteria bacterium]|nr:DUF3501 family protein [Deltaproteobacteria bacterium]